jgi:hypothetical protein
MPVRRNIVSAMFWLIRRLASKTRKEAKGSQNEDNHQVSLKTRLSKAHPFYSPVPAQLVKWEPPFLAKAEELGRNATAREIRTESIVLLGESVKKA